ncbi:hypothetical protein ANO11243_045210 [Dothideomycetidae sp. 11243]|nr:hypothetical protein ANO11243_045210 [fungal sp. No.11243]
MTKTDSTSPSLVDEEKGESPAPVTETSAPQMPSFPEGGARAWGVVLGSMIINGCSFGYATAFGVYQAYYQEHQLSHKNPSDIAWIGSIQFFFMFAGGFVSGSLFDRYGARVVMIPGTIGYVLALMFTSLCKEYWQFILAQGVFGGICNGLIFSPALAAVGHYFQKKRGAAMGLVAVGSSVGGVIFPIVLQKAFYGKVGFGWGVRAVAFAMLGLLSIACVLVVERLPPRRGRFFAPEAFRQRSYVLLLSGIFLVFWGVLLIYFFISEYAIEKIHMGTELAFYLLSITNAASLVGRVFFGALGDKAGFLSLFSLVALLNTILVFCWTATKTNAGLIVWGIVFGFTSGGVFSLFPAGIASITPKPQFIGTYMGQGMIFFAVAGLTGSPIGGAIIDKYGYLDGSMFGGASLLVGFLLIVAARFSHQPQWSVKA